MGQVNPIAPPVVQPTAPEDEEKVDGRKGRKGPRKASFPGLAVNDRGKATVQLEKVPGDFDSAVHSALRRADFKDETVWLEMRATDCEAQAVAFRDEAEKLRKLGDKVTRAKAKSLIAMQKKMDELRKQLIAKGIDPSNL